MDFKDKDILHDLLTTEKQALGSYSSGITESSCQKLRNTLMTNYKNAQEIQYQVFDEMKKKGWYTTKDAPTNEVEQLKTEATQAMQDLM